MSAIERTHPTDTASTDPGPLSSPDVSAHRVPEGRDMSMSPHATWEPQVAVEDGFRGVREELVAITDPLARAVAATRLLQALEVEREQLLRLRREAVVASGLSVRRLAAELGVGPGTVSDMKRAGHGRGRRSSRDLRGARPGTQAVNDPGSGAADELVDE
jgi:hypothetical protein